MQKEDVEHAVASLGGTQYWYQRIVMGNTVTPVFNKTMADTAFYNKGKWNHFIRPLIPFSPEGKSFVECGCNAGLYLLLAAELGFAKVSGYEGDDGWYQQARFVVDHYCRSRPDVYRRISLQHLRIGRTGDGANSNCNIHSSCSPLEWSDLPNTDLTLLANVLYWIDRHSASRYIHELARTSLFSIVVSVNGSYKRGGPCSLEEVRRAFKEDWQELQNISSPDLQDGERGRDMFSILFRSRLAAMSGNEVAGS